MEADICMLVDNAVTQDSRVLKEARTLAEAGWKVVVVGFSTPTGEPEIEERDGFTIVRSFYMNTRFSWLKDRLMLILAYAIALLHRVLPDFPLVQSLRTMLERIFAGYSRVWNASGSAAVKGIKQISAAFYHAHDYPALLLINTAYPTAKVIYDSHELYFDRGIVLENPLLYFLVASKHRMERRIEKRYAQNTLAIITVGDKIADHMVENMAVSRPIVLRNVVDLRLMGDAAFHFNSSTRWTIVHTGGLFFDRNLDRLVSALAHLPEDIGLVLLGKGPLQEQLEEIARREGTLKRLSFVPPVPPSAVSATIQQAHAAAVLTSRQVGLNGEYALPNKLFEAIAAGLPIVSGPNIEIASLMQRYEMGVICPDPSDPAQLAKAFIEILHPEQYARYAENVKKAREELNWEQEEKKLIALYRNLSER